MGATERILIPNSALTMLSVSTPEAHTKHERAVSDRLGQTNRVDATAYRWLSIMRGGNRLCHANPEPGGHGRTREDTTSPAIEYRRTRKEPPGYGRTRRCAGSGP